MTILNLILSFGVVGGYPPAIAKTTQLSHSLHSASALTALADGNYQICSQPDPQYQRLLSIPLAADANRCRFVCLALVHEGKS